MEKCQRSPEDIKKYGQLTEEQMERRAQVRGLLALVSITTNGKKRMEFVNRDFNAALNIRTCVVLETRPPEWTRENFVGQPLKVELYEKKVGSSSRWPVENHGEASASNVDTSCPGRISRRYCTVQATFDFRPAFVV